MRVEPSSRPKQARCSDISRSSSLFLFLQEGKHALEHNKEAQQGRGENVGPGGGQLAVELDNGGDGAVDEHAEQGADHVAHAAGEQCAADDGGGDGVHLHAGGLADAGRLGVQAVADAANGAQERGQHIGFQLGLFHVQAHHSRRLLTAAHSVEGAAEFRIPQDQENHNQHQQRDQHAHADVGHNQHTLPVGHAAEGQAQPPVGPAIEGGVGLLGDGQLLGGDNRRHATGEEHARHGHDEGLDLQIAHAEALDQAKDQAHRQHGEAHHRGAHMPGTHAIGQQHTVQRHQGAHGDVNAAGEHYAGHAAGHTDQARVAD